jgi:hypothetical protein
MMQCADEIAASLPNLPPGERRAAQIQITTLEGVISELLGEQQQSVASGTANHAQAR